MNINDLYDPEFRKLIKSKKITVIIPVGSIEQHGAHLPISTDSDIVTEIALRLAKKCGFRLLLSAITSQSECFNSNCHQFLKNKY